MTPNKLTTESQVRTRSQPKTGPQDPPLHPSLRPFSSFSSTDNIRINAGSFPSCQLASAVQMRPPLYFRGTQTTHSACRATEDMQMYKYYHEPNPSMFN